MTTSPVVGVRSSGWGPREAPLPGASTFHRGVDIAAPTGTRVVAPQAGTVAYIGRSAARGLYVIVQHDARWRTLHQHLDSVTVYQGQRVAEGQQLGTVGATGRVTGPHLHTEVHDQGTPIDPAPWYAARGVRLGTASTVLSSQEVAMPLTQPDLEQFDRIIASQIDNRLRREAGGWGAVLSEASVQKIAKATAEATVAALLQALPAAGQVPPLTFTADDLLDALARRLTERSA